MCMCNISMYIYIYMYIYLSTYNILYIYTELEKIVETQIHSTTGIEPNQGDTPKRASQSAAEMNKTAWDDAHSGSQRSKRKMMVS